MVINALQTKILLAILALLVVIAGLLMRGGPAMPAPTAGELKQQQRIEKGMAQPHKPYVEP